MLLGLSVKNLLYEKVKFFVGLASVGLAVALILTLLGIYNGVINQARALPEGSGADYWLVEEGTRDMFHTVSILPAGLEDDIAQTLSSSRVSAALNAPTNVVLAGQDTTVGIIAYDTDTGLLGPPQVVNGQPVMAPGEIVIDSSLAKMYGVDIGQTVNIFGEAFTVSGLSKGSNAVAFQYLFMGLDDYQRLKRGEGSFVNYYLINSDTSLGQLQLDAERILPNAVVRPTSDVADDNLKVIEDSFLNIILLLVAVGAAVGTLIISITVYNATTERIRDYAVLKAVGASRRTLRLIAVTQSVMTASGGFVIGLALYFVIREAAPTLIPSVEVNITSVWVGAVGAATLLMSVVGAVIPVRRINKIDPVEVFNA